MKFHDELNNKLWDKNENKGETSYSLKSEVADKLMEIASFFIESNNIPEDAIEDIRLLGSSANFNYNKYSDIDLHLVVDFDKLHEDCPIVNDYAWAIKQIFNQEHEISIYDIPVEIYIEPIDQPANSNGVYSLIDQDWLKKPEKIEPTDNDIAVQAKFEEISQAIDKIEDSEYADELLDKIYAMRKSGLADGGEFSTENMAFKLLRNGGYLDKLREMKKANIDRELTLENYIEEMSLVELALHKDESTDIADYIDRVSKDNKKYENTKFAIPGYKLSIPFFVLINHVKKHDLDVNDYNNLFKNLNNIIAAKKTRPNSLGRETYNIGIKADNTYFYLNIAINDFDNLVCTVDKSTYKGVITHVYELQKKDIKKSLSMMPTSQPSASISNETDSVATHSQDSNNMIQYLITKINGTNENYEDILNKGEKQTMRKTIVEERVEPSEIYDLAVANLPAEDIDHHASDLYIRKTPESEALIKQMGDRAMLSTFVDNIDGDVWYDLPFCYKPYWTKSESLENKKINEGNFEQQSTAWYDFCAYVKQIMSEGHDFDEAVYEAIDDTVYGADVINIWTNLPGNLGSRENEIVDLMREDIQEACYEEQEYIEGLDESLQVNEISDETVAKVGQARSKELDNAQRAFIRKKMSVKAKSMQPGTRAIKDTNPEDLEPQRNRLQKAQDKAANFLRLRGARDNKQAQSESLADSILKEAHEVLSMNESADATTWSFKANGFSKAMVEKQNVFGNSEVRCVITENANGKLEGTATVNYFMTKEQVEEAIKNALRENGFRTTVISELVNLY